MFVCVLQYYEMSYGLNVEMHKQVSLHVAFQLGTLSNIVVLS